MSRASSASSRSLNRLACAIALLACASLPARAQVLVDFELGAPCWFQSAYPLTEQYASLGVHFRGPSALDGGAVLDQCGIFGTNAVSGTNFLAFNHASMPMMNGGIPKDPEEILFDFRVVQASIWAFSSSPANFLIQAFDGNLLVDSKSVPSSSTWVQISLSPPGGFTRLMIDSSSQVFVFDDLAFDPQVAVTYCTGKLNSLGCLPAIAATGIPRASSASGFDVRATNIRNQKQGILFYGVSGRAAIPFQGGTLCIAPQIKRTPAVNSGGTPLPSADCTGVYSIDMNAFAAGALGGNPLPALQQPGTVVDCQFWGRDPGIPPPNNTALTNALEYVVGS